MITVENSKGKRFTIPNAWEELTPTQYVCVAQLIMRLLNGELDVRGFRFALLKELTGFRSTGKKYSEQELDLIYGNLTMLAEKITFALKPSGDRHTLSLSFKKNPLPQLRIGRRTFTGARFTIDHLVDTDITARQFCDAYDVLAAYAKTRHDALLSALCAIIYGGAPYNISKASLLEKKYFARVGFPQKYAVLIWFMGVTRWLASHPVYCVLFAGGNRDSGEEGRISLGMGEAVMQLSHAGFGSIEEIGSLSVTDFFDLMVKDLKRQLAEALAKGVKKEILARQAGLTYAQLAALVRLT
jgi:hypothetical protein